MGTINPTITPASADPLQTILSDAIGSLTKAVGSNPNVSITTDVGAVANCLTEALKFAQTAQGQEMIKDLRTAGSQIELGIAKVGTWFEGLFKKA